MAVSSELVVFAIRAALRLGRAVQMELEAHIRNRDVPLPPLLTIELDPIESLRAEMAHNNLVNDEFKSIFKRYGEADNLETRQKAEQEIYVFATECGLVVQTEQAQNERGIMTIRQWSQEADQGVALARIGLALVEIAIDYASSNPGIFGVGGNGERFVRAALQAMDEILPDSGTPGQVKIMPEQLFGERALAIFMHTGLSTLQAHIAENVEEDHLRDIAISVLNPLVSNFRNQEIDRKTLNEFRDLLLGPMAQEAINAVVRNQKRFLGSRFAKDKGLGAATEAILRTVAEEGNIRNVATREMWINVYGAVLDVAIQRPELFAGKSRTETSVFGRDLVQVVAKRLKEMTPPFTASVAAVAATDAIGVLSRHAGIFFDRDDPWEVAAGKMVDHILTSISTGMQEGLRDGTPGEGRVLDGASVLTRLFSEDQVNALVRIVIDQVARTPGMLTGGDQRDEVKALVSGIARAISNKNGHLLSPEDWLEVVATVAEEAAKNPGRLFRITADEGQPIDPDDEVAVRIISSLLTAAAADFSTRGRAGGAVLFGETLRKVMIDALSAVADIVHMDTATDTERDLIALVERINRFRDAEPGGFGCREWLRIFNIYLKLVLVSENGTQLVDNLSDEELRHLILSKAD